MTNAEYERLAGKLYKLALSLDKDAARLNGVNKKHHSKDLTQASALIKYVSKGLILMKVSIYLEDLTEGNNE